jgi:hypothetical protein
MGAENLATTRFDPRTFQSIASRYTDCTIPAHVCGQYPTNYEPFQVSPFLHYICEVKEKFSRIYRGQQRNEQFVGLSSGLQSTVILKITFTVFYENPWTVFG